MNGFRLGILAGVVALTLLCSCNPFRRSRTPRVPSAPVPAPPAAESPLEPQPSPEPKPLPPPPEVEPPPVTSLPPAPPEAMPPTVHPSPPSQPARHRPTEQPPPQEPPPQQEPAGPVAIPQLTQLLTPEQERRYNNEIDESLSRVYRNLEILSGRRLDEEQKTVLSRIQAFVRQTIETRGEDLVTARSLAARADLLARELERTSR